MCAKSMVSRFSPRVSVSFCDVIDSFGSTLSVINALISFVCLNSLLRLGQQQHLQQRHGYSTEKQQKTKVDDAAGTEQQPKTDLAPEIERLTQELATAKEQHSELLDKYKRSLADSENMRTRLNKQISDAKIFGIQSFCKDLLEVADTLGHATQAVPKEKVCRYFLLPENYHNATVFFTLLAWQ